MVKVKICGITNLEDAMTAIDHGADYLGFNFYEKSPRYITPEATRDLLSKLGDAATAVGVFVNKSAADVIDMSMLSGVNVVQLHGDEKPDDAKYIFNHLGLEVVKAFRLSDDFDESALDDFEHCSFLLDANAPGVYGGSGELADWTAAKRIVEKKQRVFLAGGLDTANVADAIRTVRPYAVDVASGVESSPGKKDPKRVATFIKAAKEAL